MVEEIKSERFSTTDNSLARKMREKLSIGGGF
jgi:hypothetical protein